MDHGEGELSLGQILAKPFVLSVFGAGQIHIVITNLEDQSDQVDQGHTISVAFFSVRNLGKDSKFETDLSL